MAVDDAGAVPARLVDHRLQRGRAGEGNRPAAHRRNRAPGRVAGRRCGRASAPDGWRRREEQPVDRGSRRPRRGRRARRRGARPTTRRSRSSRSRSGGVRRHEGLDRDRLGRIVHELDRREHHADLDRRREVDEDGQQQRRHQHQPFAPAGMAEEVRACTSLMFQATMARITANGRAAQAAAGRRRSRRR